MLQCKNSQHTAFQQETSIVHADRLERTVRHESVGSDLANVCDVNSRRAREVAREHCRKRSLWTAKLILHGCEERWDDQRREARLAGSVPWRLCGDSLRTVHRSGFSNSKISGCLQNAHQSLSCISFSGRSTTFLRSTSIVRSAFLSVMGFSLRTSFMWSDPDSHYGSPTFLLAMGWAFSSVGTTLIATVLCAAAAESIVSLTT